MGYAHFSSIMIIQIDYMNYDAQRELGTVQGGYGGTLSFLFPLISFAIF